MRNVLLIASIIFTLSTSLKAYSLESALNDEDQLQEIDQNPEEIDPILEEIAPNRKINNKDQIGAKPVVETNQERDEEEEETLIGKDKGRSLPTCRSESGIAKIKLRRRTKIEPDDEKEDLNDVEENNDEQEEEEEEEADGPIPCTCGVFLSGQFKKGSKKAQPKGMPVLTQEIDTPFKDNAVGIRQCTNKCLELVIKHLPKSHEIICGTVDRDVFKERVYLFIKNVSDKWHGTNLSAGREYCCKDNESYKCPPN